MKIQFYKLRNEFAKNERIIFGLSSLYYIASGEFNLNSRYAYGVPDNLLRLLERANEGSEEHAVFLRRIVLEEHQDEEQLSIDNIRINLSAAFGRLEELGRLVTIDETKVNREIEDELTGSFESSNYEISLSPKSNFVKDYFTRALSWSKEYGALIIESSKSKFVELGSYIVSLQIPDKADAFVERKQSLIDGVFNFRGAKAAKWFIGGAVAVGGFMNPMLGVAGIAIAFIDP